MRLSKKILGVILSALVLCAGFSLLFPPASAAEYEDGVYSVGVSTLGEGWHNTIVSPTTVYIEDGNIYTDIVFLRTSTPLHAPVYVSLTTAYGTYTDPVINESNYTCAFYHVRIDSLGEIPFSAVTEAMSMPYSVDYSVYIDPDAVPLKADEPPAPTEDPVPTEDPAPAEDPAPSEEPASNDEPAPAEEPKPAEDPAPAENPAPESGKTEKPEDSNTAPEKTEPSGSGDDPAPSPDKDDAPANAPAANDDPAAEAGGSSPALSTGATIGIAAAAVVIIAVIAVIAKKKK